MSNSLFEQTVCDGIYALAVAILSDKKLAKYREELISHSSTVISGCGTVELYVDNSYLPDNATDTSSDNLPSTSLFAVLRTPVVDITISNNKIYSYVYETLNMNGKSPNEIDLESVLKEVDRVALTDKSFRVDSTIKRAKNNNDPTTPQDELAEGPRVEIIDISGKKNLNTC